MSNPGYFPPSSEQIQQLGSSTKRLVIDTSNWPQMRKIIASQTKDPLSPKFNWAFWCGYIDDNAFNKICQKI